ncbi:MAG: DUF5058 family protein [Gallicola sp.]|nr:DUF5058 family protein [Gallicola sp.]
MGAEHDRVMGIANSFPMWLAAGIAIALALVQAFIFYKKSVKAGKELGVTEDQIKAASRSAFITSIGPSIVILSGVLALMVSIGGPMAWMRLSFIGSLMFEMMAAGFGTGATGVQLGVDPMTEAALGTAVWTMILGSIGWIIMSGLTTDKMAKIQDKFTKGNATIVAIISTSALLGAFGALVAPHLLAFNANTVAAIAGAAIMLALSMFDRSGKAPGWIKEWALAIALFGGMIIAVIAG